MDIEKILAELTLEEKADILYGADVWQTKELERFGIPKLALCDGPNGLRKQAAGADHLGISESVKAVCFPTGSALAASFDVALARMEGRTLGSEYQAENVAMLLGPGVNIKRSPLCGRNFEYFSEDAYLAGKIGAAYVEGVQGEGVSVCVKHYAANNQETRRASGNSVVDERALHEIYLAAFETIVKEAKPRSIMCSYNRINGTFASENKLLLTEILRNKWGFGGLVVTDWGAVKDPVIGIKAGLDLVMPGGNDAIPKKIIAAVQNGELAEEELNRAVRNVLKFMADAVNSKKADTVFHYEADYQTAVKIAKECAVLLKNDHGVLPIRKDASVAFIGGDVKKPRVQGAGSSRVNSMKISNALEAASGLNVIYLENADGAGDYDYAVVFVSNATETEGADRETLDLPADQNALVAAAAAANKNTIVVLHNGAPVTMPWLDNVSAVLEMYLAGDGCGEAAVSILFGDTNPSGKLAETFPKKLSDNPSYLNFPGERGLVEYREGVFVGYRYYDKKELDVLFPFGHGLSYTTFEYSGLKLDKTDMEDSETLVVSAAITNTGKIFGKETVQLYVRGGQSAVNRPARELKGFVKVALEAGVRKEVTFTLDKRAFAYYETRIHDFAVETGEFVIEICASSRDIRLSASVNVRSAAVVPFVYDRDSIVSDITATPKGKALFDEMRSRMQRPVATEDILSILGEDARLMSAKMMEEMPLRDIQTFAGLTDEELDGVIAELNA